jgi:hypothetical protein
MSPTGIIDTVNNEACLRTDSAKAAAAMAPIRKLWSSDKPAQWGWGKEGRKEMSLEGEKEKRRKEVMSRGNKNLTNYQQSNVQHFNLNHCCSIADQVDL